MIWLHSLFRRQILKPFFAATRSILAIANGNLSVRVPSPNNYRGEIRALLEAVHTLKRYSLDKQQLEQDRQRLIAQLTTMAETDALTQLLNRRALEARACDLCASPEADKPYVALVMFDIDHFKRINDTYGHIAGDRALEIVGAVCRDVLGTGDLAARFGGEEFAVVSLVSTRRSVEARRAAKGKAARDPGDAGERQTVRHDRQPRRRHRTPGGCRPGPLGADQAGGSDALSGEARGEKSD
jgi:diguanylate cyclase (GGDEF)-like protein